MATNNDNNENSMGADNDIPHAKVYRMHLDFLMESLNVDEILPKLFAKSIISQKERERLRRIFDTIGPSRCTEELFTEVLPRNPNTKSFEILLNILEETGQEELASRLKNEYNSITENRNVDSLPDVQVPETSSLQTEKTSSETAEMTDQRQDANDIVEIFSQPNAQLLTECNQADESSRRKRPLSDNDSFEFCFGSEDKIADKGSDDEDHLPYAGPIFGRSKSIKTDSCIKGYPYSVTKVLKSPRVHSNYYSFMMHTKENKHVRIVSAKGIKPEMTIELQRIENMNGANYIGFEVDGLNPKKDDEEVYFISKNTTFDEVHLDYAFERKYFTVRECTETHTGRLVDIAAFKIHVVMPKERVKNETKADGEKDDKTDLLIGDATGEKLWLEVYEAERINISMFQKDQCYKAMRCLTRTVEDAHFLTTVEDTSFEQIQGPIPSPELTNENEKTWLKGRITLMRGKIERMHNIDRYTGCAACKTKLQGSWCGKCNKEPYEEGNFLFIEAIFAQLDPKEKFKIKFSPDIIEELISNEELSDKDIARELKAYKSILLRKTPGEVVVSIEEKEK